MAEQRVQAEAPYPLKLSPVHFLQAVPAGEKLPAGQGMHIVAAQHCPGKQAAVRNKKILFFVRGKKRVQTVQFSRSISSLPGHVYRVSDGLPDSVTTQFMSRAQMCSKKT